MLLHEFSLLAGHIYLFTATNEMGSRRAYNERCGPRPLKEADDGPSQFTCWFFDDLGPLGSSIAPVSDKRCLQCLSKPARAKLRMLSRCEDASPLCAHFPLPKGCPTWRRCISRDSSLVDAVNWRYREWRAACSVRHRCLACSSLPVFSTKFVSSSICWVCTCTGSRLSVVEGQLRVHRQRNCEQTESDHGQHTVTVPNDTFKRSL